LSVHSQQSTRTSEGKKVHGGTEFEIFWTAVPEWGTVQSLETKVCQSLISAKVRSGVKVNFHRFPKPSQDGEPVCIGRIHIPDPRQRRGNSVENERKFAEHETKIATAMAAVDSALERAELDPKTSHPGRSRIKLVPSGKTA
jgi:hypothetical protein